MLSWENLKIEKLKRKLNEAGGEIEIFSSQTGGGRAMITAAGLTS